MGLGFGALTRVLIAHFIGVNDPAMVKSIVWKSIYYSYGTSLVPAVLVLGCRSQIWGFLFEDELSQKTLEKSLVVAAFHIPVNFTITLLISLFM